MKMPCKTLQVALLVAIAGSAVAAPTVSTTGGETRVVLSSTLVGALESLNVSLKAQYPAYVSNGAATFPIPVGEIDLGNARGQISHSGGLVLRAGKTSVGLSNFVIDTSGSSPVLTGLVRVDDELVGRVPLFSIKFNAAPLVNSWSPTSGSLRVVDVDLKLTSQAAAALNQSFSVSAFSAGVPIGRARVQAHWVEPDRIR